MKMKQFQRLLAFVLVICMVVPMLPEFTLPVAATDTSTTEDPVIVIAGSDFQPDTAYDTTTVSNILSYISQNGYSDVDGFLFAGDYSQSFTVDTSTTALNALKEVVNDVYPTLSDTSKIYIQGNHDPDSMVTDGTLSASGAHDADAYGVYVINEKDYMWYNDDETTIKNTAAALDTYLDAKVAANYDKPIFVVSHLPLHYNMRTCEGDGMYANYIFDVLNDAGAAGLNIIFLFGHNHSNGWDDYLGGAAVYLAKGDSINIAQASRSNFEVETLNFTYMNAGYVGYYRGVNDGSERDLTMTVFEIRGNEVTIARYSESGIHDLKSKGVTNSYKNETAYAPNTRVYKSGQLAQPGGVLTDAGVTVAAPGVISLTVKKGNISELPDGYKAYQTFDIKAESFIDGDTALVTLPVDDSFDATLPAIVIDHEKNKVIPVQIANGNVVFTTDHFSLYTVAQADVESYSATGIVPTLQRVTDGVLEEGVPYVISDFAWNDAVLTTTVGEYSGSKGKYKGFLLEGTPSPDSTKWYIRDEYIVHGSADSNDYLWIYEDTTTFSGCIGYITLGEFDSNKCAKPLYMSADDFNVTSTSNYLLNRRGAGNNNVATVFQQSTTYKGSMWHFDKVVYDQTATLTVTPSQNTVMSGKSIALIPSVLIGTDSAESYEISYSSGDTSIAAVSADGIVTGYKAGQVTITVTLSSAGGSNLVSPISVEVPITVVTVSKDESSVTATTIMNLMGEQATLTDGTDGGPYVLLNHDTKWVLSGNTGAIGLDDRVGLELLANNDVQHVWYVDSDGNGNTYLRYASPDGDYLVFDDSLVSLMDGGTDLSNLPSDVCMFDKLDTHDEGTSYAMYASKFWSNWNAVNHYGGVPYIAAGRYPYRYTSGCYGGSYWYFYNAILDTNISLTVSPNRDLLYPGDTSNLTPTVKLNGEALSNYTLTWTSSDTSVATVDANGKVTAVSGGNVVITASLSTAYGNALDPVIFVEIPVQVISVTTEGGSITATMDTGHAQQLVTSLETGVPYVITHRKTGDVLTGIPGMTSAHCNNGGLGLTPYNDYSHIWYYDGTHLIYGSPDGVNNYMVYKNSQVTLGSKNDTVFDLVEPVSGENTFTISYTGASQGVNQLGGSGFYAAGMYSKGDSGSRWVFNKVVAGKTVSITVTPDSAKLYAGSTVKLSPTVMVEGETASDYKLTWSTSDYEIASVYQGTVTGASGGDAVITATVHSVNGEDLDVPLYVKIPIKVIGVKAATLSSYNGSVAQRASAKASTGVNLTVTYDDNTTKTIPVTVEMLKNGDGNRVSTYNAGTFNGLSVNYGGYEIAGFTLEVAAPDLPNYPEYPAEGSVAVDKTGVGIDFQSSGIAQIELSVTGVPVKTGADVIIMLDTSSSMLNENVGDTTLRIQSLTASLNELLNTLQEKDANGNDLDIRVAIADFNGYYHDSYSNYYINENDTLAGNTIRGTQYAAKDQKIFTGDHTLTVGAFQKVHELGKNPFTCADYTGETSGKFSLVTHFGTNYDYAFDAIYQMASSVTEANASGEERDLFVIFMSDGAPFQYNYWSAQSNVDNSSEYWNNWLLGTMEEEMYGPNANREYYNKDGLHWMAEAIKGDPTKDYPVIRKNDPKDTNADNWIELPGLGATMYSIGFSLKDDNKVLTSTMETVIQRMATSSKHYFKADDTAQLGDAFTQIASEILYAASDAYFLDTMGEDYDLLKWDHEYKDSNNVTQTVKPTIEVKSYSVYTNQDVADGLCTISQIGNRKTDASGKYVYTTLETVTFDQTGVQAYTGGDTTTNILIDGVICANTFWYNTTTASVKIDVDGDGTKETTLAAETFYWKVGTISTVELTLGYYVYLTGSLEGSRQAGVYDTNEHAELFYTNYLGNACSLEVPTPKLPWKQASVGYGFYLVDENGNPIVNQTTGKTGSFSYAVKLTDPIYKHFLLNSDGAGFDAGYLVTAGSVLPDGYELYDTGATYQVQMGSNGIGYYIIGSGETVQTTYVTGLSSTAVTNTGTPGTQINTTGYTTASTVVWFAVKATTKVVPDTVVIDFGLPVDIHPLVNDLMMSTGNAVLAGIGLYDSSLTYTATLDSDFVDTEWLTIGTYGKAQITATGTDNKNNAVIRYVPGTMQMEKEVVFTYAVHYTGTVGSQGYYYSTVTVIPATTIYYEDNFKAVDGVNNYITYSTYTQDSNGNTTNLNKPWTSVEDADSNTPSDSQAEDRPGDYNISFGNIDANNLYGYDGAYTAMKTYSNGSAMKFTAGTDGSKVTYGTAQFTFKGTGFDVISLTSNETGTIVVEVDDLNEENVNGVAEYYYVVDTYYGYKYEDGKWVVDTDSTDALYQVPVIKAEYATYSQYKVTITATYADFFDHKMENGQYTSYDFYLDAIRIYDPANDGTDNTVIQGTYTDDAEGWPSYQELRNMIITKNTFDSLGADDSVEGIVFIDGNEALSDSSSSQSSVKEKGYAISDYINFGPNNELYLAPNQAIAFDLANVDNVASIQIALKTVGDFSTGVYGSVNKIPDGSGAASVNIYDASDTDKTNVISTGSIATATDMYYDITDLMGKTVIIQNTGSAGILSITNVKITYKQDPYGTSSTGLIGSTSNTVFMALAALNAVEEEEQPEQKPEGTPEQNIPGTDVEENPVTGDLNVEIVCLMVLTFCVMTLAVLVNFDTRKRNTK